MARPRTKIDITCQNPACKYYLKEEGKDILKRGKNRAGHQQYYCNHCNTWFVETVNTPLYHKHLSKSEIIQICKHLVEKNGIRSIERITGHHRDTIGRLLEDLAAHAELVNDILLNEIKLGQFEVDEMWTTIKKNRRKLSQEAQTQMMKVMPGYTVA
ncbi:MAG TPA: IS1 family transposase [Candidatus Methanoperedenaceae archaeon]|nr:IS1 family transposase [Candidatus Methanoperedenaceae archaeon]